MKKKITEARVYLDVDPEVVFVFNGFWTVTSIKDVKDTASTVVVSKGGKKRIYNNVTIEEALEKFEKSG